MKRVAKKKQIVEQEREQHWYIPPSGGIPVYRADTDPYCPAARVRKFNEEQKQRVRKEVNDRTKSEQWVSAALDRQYSNVPLKNLHDFRAKASEYNSNSNISEIGILQKIIVRENLLNELSKLLKVNSDLAGVLSEVSELIQALRFETLDIVEDIAQWQSEQPVGRPFLFKGINYLIKLRGDLDFLDNHDEIVERFCFEFKSNPLAYRGGGNIIIGFDSAKASAAAAADAQYARLMSSYTQAFNDNTSLMVDGIQIIRLHNAEKVIQSEFQRIMSDQAHAQQQGLSLGEQTMSQYHDPGTRSRDPRALRASWESAASYDPMSTDMVQQTESVASLPQPSASASVTSASASKKKTALFNPKKAKLERITAIQEEASSLQAMIAHIHDKIAALSQEVKEHAQRAGQLLKKEAEARDNGREGAALHIAAEVSLVNAFITEKRSAIKDLHREAYFIALERRRKLGVIKTMQDEMAMAKQRDRIKKKIEAKIKKDGLMAALQQFDSEKLTVDSLKLGGAKGKGKSKGKDKKKHIQEHDQDLGSTASEVELADYNRMLDEHEHIEDMMVFQATDSQAEEEDDDEDEDAQQRSYTAFGEQEQVLEEEQSFDQEQYERQMQYQQYQQYAEQDAQDDEQEESFDQQAHHQHLVADPMEDSYSDMLPTAAAAEHGHHSAHEDHQEEAAGHAIAEETADTQPLQEEAAPAGPYDALLEAPSQADGLVDPKLYLHSDDVEEHAHQEEDDMEISALETSGLDTSALEASGLEASADSAGGLEYSQGSLEIAPPAASPQPSPSPLPELQEHQPGQPQEQQQAPDSPFKGIPAADHQAAADYDEASVVSQGSKGSTASKAAGTGFSFARFMRRGSG